MRSACTFYIVRHGEAVMNRDRIVMGQLDSPLSERGQNEAAHLAKEFQATHFDAVMVSNLRRAMDTARIITNLPTDQFDINTKLRERTFGSLEGRPQAELQLLRGKHAALSAEELWELPVVADAESDAAVFGRVHACLLAKAQQYAGQKVLVVTHSGPIRTLLIGLHVYNQKDLPPGSFGHGQYMVLEAGKTGIHLKGIYPALRSEEYKITE